MKKLKKYLPILVIIALSITAWVMDVHHYLSFDKLKANQSILKHYIAEHQVIALLLYMASYVAIVSLSLPVAAFMTIAGGVLFGQVFGTLGTVVAATFGASILFFSAKLASSDLLSLKLGKWASKMQKGFQEDAFLYLLTLRMIPLFPFVAVNLASALFQIPLRTFMLATFFGIIPGTFVYTSIGVALGEVLQTEVLTPQIIVDPKILIALGGLGVLSLLPIIYKYWKGMEKRSKANL